MRLERDDMQRDLTRAMRATLDEVAGPGERLDPVEVHACLVELGVFALELPDADGGLAFGMDCAVVVCEELGRWAAPDSYRAGALLTDLVRSAEEAGTGFRSRASAASPALIGAGKVTASLAIGSGVAATPACDGRRLSGDCVLPDVPPQAAFHVVPARYGDGTVLAAMAVDAPGLTVDGPRADGVWRLSLEDVAPDALSPPLHHDGIPSPLLARARIRQAAYLLGLASGAHRLAVGRAASRRQFGRGIGENQAVAFPLAEQYAHLEAVRLLVHEAGWDADGGRSAAVRATQSLAYAAELALQVTAHAVHVHGAAGITTDSPVQRHYRAARIEATRWGAPVSLWREAGALRLR
ncbi:acyl-CoA dehydrogenase family protein [Streptomyces sp. NBC_00286]|uniref:acyl-CoA dehydrogenase family protein n=1 Tax=Streptomyces sp. NBC_00286 TaxID=2975701 RepID=UPI002E294A7F|nr:acyl-CoA dehydrogenase family protein [Streptomyces sp. NBC_00286]